MTTFTRAITLTFPDRDEVKERWSVQFDLHCPRCAKAGVWKEDGPGDYYVGEKYACAECGAVFFLPNGIREPGHDPEWDDQRLALLGFKSPKTE